MKVAVVYWSGTGNTEMMAQAMAEGAREAGAEVELLTPEGFPASKLGNFDALLLGCPAMGNEVLEESEFEPMFTALEKHLEGVPVGLFGSYGWGSGEWMEDWQARCKEHGANVFGDGVIVNNTPDDEALAQCRSFAEGFVKENS
ncbi:flavodoxin [Anaerovibrio sp.]|uniref:flavodoxin n=1 Tax=Anaerovibrio sp. TaxID=1872532 RepID=UPI003F17AE67